MEKMNLSVKFLSHKMDTSPDAFVELVTYQIDGFSDIIIGFVSVFPAVAISRLAYTFLHSGDLFSVFVLCSPRIYRMGKLFSLCSFHVWLTFAFVLTSATFWCLEKKLRRSKSRKLCSTTSIFLSVYNAWAILLAGSVPKMPKIWTHRILFCSTYFFFCHGHRVSNFLCIVSARARICEEVDNYRASDLIYAYHPIFYFL
jgi:hypothetical protein